MSNAQNDIYFEEVAEQEQEVSDAKIAYLNAMQESYEAQRWTENRYNKWHKEIDTLKALKEKNI